jgi:integrase
MKKIFFLSHHNYNLDKRWYIRYVENSVTKKVYGNINKYKTVKERLDFAQILIDQLHHQRENRHKSCQLENEFAPLRTDLLNLLESIKHTLRPASIRMYRSKILVFSRWCKEKKVLKLEDLQKSNINEFLIEILKTRKSVTYNHFKVVLSLLLGQIDKKYLSLFDEVKPIKSICTPSKIISKTDIEKLKDIFLQEDAELWIFCQMIYFTLIRPAELRLLKIGDINLDLDIITVRGETSKNKKTQNVAIPKQLKEVLIKHGIENYPKHYFIFGKQKRPSENICAPSHFFYQHKLLLKKYGFDTKEYRIYSWKHTGSVAMVKSGIHIKFIQTQGRWHSLDMVDKYLRQLGAYDMSEVINLHTL